MLMGVAEKEARMVRGPVSAQGMAVESNGLLVHGLRLCHPLIQRTQLIFFFYPLLLPIWISLVICHVPKEPFLYSSQVEEKEAMPVPDSGTLVIRMRGLGPSAVLLVSVSLLVL